MRGHGMNALGRTIRPLVSSARGDAARPVARGAGDSRAALELLRPDGRDRPGGDRTLARGLVALPFGLVGVAGAILYTVPPLRAAYRPFAGEAIAFGCLADCVIGAHVLQGGRGIDVAAVATAIAVAAYAVGMLMVHHYL